MPKSNDPLFYLKKGDVLKTQGKTNDAIKEYERAVSLKKNLFEVYNKIGNLYFDLDNMEKAIYNYKYAIKLNPNFHIAYNNLGNALQSDGEINNAITAYEKAIDIKPNFALAYRNISTIKKFKKKDSLLNKMENLAKANNLTTSDKININFSLGKANNDIGEFKNAYNYFDQANTDHNKKIQYEIKNDENFFINIKNLFSNKFSPVTKSILRDHHYNSQPIFILGMPRSGSTLVEQIISSHSKVCGGGELIFLDQIIRAIDWQNIKNYEDVFRDINSKYLKSINFQKRNEKYITDKMPLNFRWIGFILLSIPEVKIIHTKRDAVATCWSIYKNFFVGREHDFSYNEINIIKYYKIYINLMNFWKEKFPNRIYDFVYEDVVKNFEVESKKLIEYIDLDWEEECLNFNKVKRVIKTNSSFQVRQGIYKESLTEWHNYREYLQTFINKLDHE